MSVFEWKSFRPKMRLRGAGYQRSRRHVRVNKRLKIHSRITTLGFNIGKKFDRQFTIGFWFRYHLRWKLSESAESASARIRAVYRSPLRKFTIRYAVSSFKESNLVPHLEKRKSRRNLMNRKFDLYHV